MLHFTTHWCLSIGVEQCTNTNSVTVYQALANSIGSDLSICLHEMQVLMSSIPD